MAYRLLAGAAACALIGAGPALGDDYRWRGGWDRGHGGWDRHYDDHRGRRGHRDRKDDTGEDAALLIGGAIVGFALGSLLDNNSQKSSSYYQQPYSGGYDYGYASGYDYGYGGGGYGGGYSLGAPSYDYGYAAPAPSYQYAPPQPSVTYVNSTPSYAGTGCRQVRSGRAATGAVIGGIIGGLMGNEIAASDNREEGTAVGAALGAVVGGSVGNSSADCDPNAATVYQTGYQQAAPAPSYGYQPAPAPAPSYPSTPYQDSYRWEDELYGGPDYEDSYDGPAARECERVMRVTPMPDGREIHEPVEVCREAYYGDWSQAE